jgi:hypothetical protein
VDVLRWTDGEYRTEDMANAAAMHAAASVPGLTDGVTSARVTG